MASNSKPKISRSPLTVQEEEIAFYYEIGTAITTWAIVEVELCWLAATAFPLRDRGRFAIGFFAIENFRSKLAFADRVFRAKYLNKHLATWDKLYADLERLS